MSSSSWRQLTRATPLIKLFRYDEIGSTNDRARTYLKRIRTPLAGPVLFTADRQTAGRGRGDHIWWSPEGGLFLSFAARRVDLGFSDGESVELSLAAAQAAARTIRQAAEPVSPRRKISVRVKHPNDVLLNGKKVAGILIESPASDLVIIGIGVNLNRSSEPVPAELREKYITLEEVRGKPIDPVLFTMQLSRELFQ